MRQKIKISSIRTPEIRDREFGYVYCPIEQAIKALVDASILSTSLNLNVFVENQPNNYQATLVVKGPRSHVNALLSTFHEKGDEYFVLKRCVF